MACACGGNPETGSALVMLFNMLVRPKAYFKGELDRILDQSYENVVQFWPEEVRFTNDHSAEYVDPFPETPSKMPENLKGLSFSSTQSFSFTPVKKKWLTEEFMAEVDRKIVNLERAANFPECSLRLSGFDLLKEIAADASRAPNDKIAIDMLVQVQIEGKKNTPAPQQ